MTSLLRILTTSRKTNQNWWRETSHARCTSTSNGIRSRACQNPRMVWLRGANRSGVLSANDIHLLHGYWLFAGHNLNGTFRARAITLPPRLIWWPDVFIPTSVDHKERQPVWLYLSVTASAGCYLRSHLAPPPQHSFNAGQQRRAEQQGRTFRFGTTLLSSRDISFLCTSHGKEMTNANFPVVGVGGEGENTEVLLHGRQVFPGGTDTGQVQREPQCAGDVVGGSYLLDGVCDGYPRPPVLFCLGPVDCVVSMCLSFVHDPQRRLWIVPSWALQQVDRNSQKVFMNEAVILTLLQLGWSCDVSLFSEFVVHGWEKAEGEISERMRWIFGRLLSVCSA